MPPRRARDEELGEDMQTADSEYFLNHIYLIEAAHLQRQNETYYELRRLIVFAAVFFLFIVIFILLKFQISLDDVFKWSPVVWLVGVVVCGLLMNLFLHLRRFFKRRRAKRLREQQNLLYSLNLPSSFPCLAPPPHDGHCCRFGGSPVAEARQRIGTDSEVDGILPSYDQAMHDGRTWLLSRAAFPSNIRGKPLPPTYSTVCLAQNFDDPPALHVGADEPIPPAGSSRSHPSRTADRPPPAYDETLGTSPYRDTVESSIPPRVEAEAHAASRLM